MEEDIKRRWRETEIDATTDRRTIDRIVSGRSRTALQRLELRYRRFAIFASAMTVCIPCLMSRGEILPDNVAEICGMGVKWWLITGFAIFFATAAIMDFWLSRGIRGIDVQSWPVAQVIRRALYYRRRHLQFQLILIPMAAMIICGLVSLSRNDMSVYGMIAGGAVGLAIGLREWLKFMADYRQIADGVSDE